MNAPSEAPPAERAPAAPAAGAAAPGASHATPHGATLDGSRAPGFWRAPLHERLALLERTGHLSRDGARALARGDALPVEVADQMVENALGVLGLPLGLGVNFRVNGRDVLVPMAVEEPSVVAAASHAALLVRGAGGFESHATASEMIAQVHLLGFAAQARAEAAAARVRAAAAELCAEADALQPAMLARGGGTRGVEVRVLSARDTWVVVVHLVVDVGDAMGANAVNTLAEAVAPTLERLTGGRSVLRILSNLSDRRRVVTRASVPVGLLTWHGFSGEDVAAGIAEASLCAEADPYRAATHNKGIFNGIDAAAIASGNDWRAIEAGAHAWAARDGQYRPLAVWTRERDAQGRLVLSGVLEMPLAVGTVGGPILVHPIVQVARRLLGVENARGLAEVLGAVGLASNLAALKALATEGIQRGHMARHARTVALAAGARADEVDVVARRIAEAGDVKLRAAELALRALRAGAPAGPGAGGA